MDKEFVKEDFESLSIKKSVVNKFKKYSRSIGKSRSMTLLLMLEFFEFNHISPTESLGPRMETLEAFINKRINALIAIVRSIEQEQTLPTKGMLEALFEGLPERSSKKSTPSFEEAFMNIQKQETHVPPKVPGPERMDLENLLKNLEQVNPVLGKPYWKINLDNSEIARLKSKYHVHHH